jgi:hypothetical protein
MYTIEDCVPGETWACKFTTQTFVDHNGRPIRVTNLQPGQAHPGQLGEYTSIGVIRKRDTVNHLVEVVDVSTELDFVVPFSATSDVDRAEFVDPEHEVS